MLIHWTASYSLSSVTASFTCQQNLPAQRTLRTIPFQAINPDPGSKFLLSTFGLGQEICIPFFFFFKMSQKPKSYFPPKNSYKSHTNKGILVPGFQWHCCFGTFAVWLACDNYCHILYKWVQFCWSCRYAKKLTHTFISPAIHKVYSTEQCKNLNEDRIFLGLMKKAEKESSEPSSSALII